MSEPHKQYKLEEVARIVGLGKSTIHAMEADGRFPRGRMVGGNRKVWFAEDIREWQETLPRSGAGRMPPKRRTRQSA